jgi:predicted DNA-binding protein with PD1-like motif
MYERIINMDGHAFECSKFWVVRIDPDDDVLISLKKFIKDKEIKQGVVVMGYGTLGKISLHWVEHNRWPPNSNYDQWEGGIEIMSINGMIVDGEPHVHITASDRKGAYGGHLEEGCICYVLCEIGIVEVSGAQMTREMVTISNDAQGNPVKRPQLKFVE